MALAVPALLCCRGWEVVQRPGIYFFSTEEQVDPLKDPRRTVIYLSKPIFFYPWMTYPILSFLDMDGDLFLSLYRQLGEGDSYLGKSKFRLACEKKCITVERIGFSCKKEAQFFLILGLSPKTGTNNEVYLGFDLKRGKARAVHRRFCPKFEPPKHALELSQKGCRHDYICRIKGWEPGVQVSELGGEDLFHLQVEGLDPSVRRKIYRSLLESVDLLHQAGFVHRDMKSENVVVLRNAQKEIERVKLIDLDDLGKIGEREFKGAGSLFAYSYDRLKGHTQATSAELFEENDPKEDLWGVMIIVCELESRAKKDSLLSQGVLKRFSDYEKLCFEAFEPFSELPWEEKLRLYSPLIISELEKPLFHSEGKAQLFAGMEPSTPVDKLVMALAALFGKDRPSVAELDLESFLA